MRLTLTIATLFAACALPCHAGYMIKSSTTQLQTGKTDESVMLVDGRNLRSQAGPGQEGDMIFRGAEKKAWQIMDSQRQVMEMTEETGAAMASQMDAAMAEMKKQMADMPPAQRAVMEKMFGKSAPAEEEAAPVARLEKTGNTKEINGIECRQYISYLDDEKQSEIFVAPWGEVGAGRDSLEALTAMSAFMANLVKKMKSPFAAKMSANAFPDLSKLDGYPLLVRTFEDGAARTEARLALPVEQDVPASTFELPAGYKIVDPMAAPAGF